jgi:hypothetical protein
VYSASLPSVVELCDFFNDGQTEVAVEIQDEMGTD